MARKNKTTKTKAQSTMLTTGERIKNIEAWADKTAESHNKLIDIVAELRNRGSGITAVIGGNGGAGGGGIVSMSFDTTIEPMPPNHGKSWCRLHEQMVVDDFLTGKDIFKIADRVGRTPFAVFCKLLNSTNPYTGIAIFVEKNAYKVMGQIAVKKGLCKWA